MSCHSFHPYYFLLHLSECQWIFLCHLLDPLEFSLMAYKSKLLTTPNPSSPHHDMHHRRMSPNGILEGGALCVFWVCFKTMGGNVPAFVFACFQLSWWHDSWVSFLLLDPHHSQPQESHLANTGRLFSRQLLLPQPTTQAVLSGTTSGCSYSQHPLFGSQEFLAFSVSKLQLQESNGFQVFANLKYVIRVLPYFWSTSIWTSYS